MTEVIIVHSEEKQEKTIKYESAPIRCIKITIMDSNKQQLLKHFATVLRNHALGKQTDNLMSKNLVFYFTRKELVEMVKKSFNGTIPKEYDLVELENKELLQLIDNDFFIISYVTQKWSQEIKKEIPKKELPQKIIPKNDKKDGVKK